MSRISFSNKSNSTIEQSFEPMSTKINSMAAKNATRFLDLKKFLILKVSGFQKMGFKIICHFKSLEVKKVFRLSFLLGPSECPARKDTKNKLVNISNRSFLSGQKLFGSFIIKKIMSCEKSWRKSSSPYSELLTVVFSFDGGDKF